MTEQFIKENPITRLPYLSICDYQSAIDKYKDIQHAELETYIQFGTDEGGLTTYEYYKSKQNTIYIMTRYIGQLESHSMPEIEWIESMYDYIHR